AAAPRARRPQPAAAGRGGHRARPDPRRPRRRTHPHRRGSGSGRRRGRGASRTALRRPARPVHAHDPEETDHPMTALLTAAVLLVGALCVLNLVLTVGVIRRLREHTELIQNMPRMQPPEQIMLPAGETVGPFTAVTED